jgi:large subunit ribosomal protein L29|tara:strand:- start:1278 stop:1478 length:201 start_codon:yes stop_codon:yes gene_type:complete
MAKKAAKDFKTMKIEDLKTELIANRKLLFESNFKHKMGQLKESHTLKEARKNIARIKTEINTKNGS